MKEICENCKFWVNDTGLNGNCRRFPPSIQNENYWASDYPKIHSDYWCGEFKPGTETREENKEDKGSKKISSTEKKVKRKE